MAEQTPGYRLGKGLAATDLASRDLWANPGQEGRQPCTACADEIAARESTMSLGEQTYHVCRGKDEAARSETGARSELTRGLAPRTGSAGEPGE